MKKSDFNYDLPSALIAQYPLAERRDSRLLVLDSGVRDRVFSDLCDELRRGDLLVFNNTKVIPARLFGRKLSGGRVEILVERVESERVALAQMRSSKSPKAGSEIVLDAGVKVEVIGREDAFFRLCFDIESSLVDFLEQNGRMPLPPYIEREPDAADRQRYQTVYGEVPGAVAAPTAGLHFDHTFMQELHDQGIETASITLHVGAGTFQPLRQEDLEQAQLHRESLSVSQEVCDKVKKVKRQGGRVIAVGTTSVRALETAAQAGDIQPYQGDTRLFIRPGYQFQCVDVMITNFHLPESSLLMLVCAFGGYERVMTAYRHAVDRKYRFFSYGDAMLIHPSINK